MTARRESVRPGDRADPILAARLLMRGLNMSSTTRGRRRLAPALRMADTILERHERRGLSYYVRFERDVDKFASVIDRIA